MSEPDYTLRKLGQQVKEGKVRRTHDMIVYLFQLWLEKLGIPKESMIIRDFVKVKTQSGEEELEIDIGVKKDDKIPVLIEVIEPDPNWSLANEDVRKRTEVFLIKAFAHFIKPKIILLSDGERLFIYDENANLIDKIDDLSSIDENKEKELREMVLSALK